MKKPLLIFFVSITAQLLCAQHITYHKWEDLIAGKGDTVIAPRELIAEKRNIAQIMLQNGGDYKITANRSWLRKSLRSRYFAASIDGTLYINCKKVKINKFRFGKFYARAMRVNGDVYFCAIPVGPAAVAVVNRNIGMGDIGGAVASSSAVSQRVFYQIDAETGEVSFVGKDMMSELLADYPELKEAYLKENNQEAEVTGRYLEKLQAMK